MQNRALLEQPFDPGQIKQRKGHQGKILDYVETYNVLQRLNDAFDGEYSFEVVDWKILDDEVVVLGRLTIGDVVRMQFGQAMIQRAKGSDKPLSIGDDLKAACSDCIKKTASTTGVGLHLYRDDATAPPPAVNSNGNGEGAHETETSPDIELPHLFAKVKALGLTEADLRAQMQARSMPAKFRDLTAGHLITLYRHYDGVQASRKPIAPAEVVQKSAAAENSPPKGAVKEPAAADLQEEAKPTAAGPVSDAKTPRQKYASPIEVAKLFALAKHVGYRTLEADLKEYWETSVNDFIVPMPTYQEKLQHFNSLVKKGKVA